MDLLDAVLHGLVALVLPLAFAGLGLVAVTAILNRLLARAAFRNTLRRPKQSLLIVIGLLVGTMLVAGALVAGDSMEFAIVEATYDAFQEIDETVYVDGYYFFPQAVVGRLANDSVLRRETDAVGGNILWDAAATDTTTRQYEPLVRLVGFDPANDRPFGPFRHGHDSFDGTALGRDDVVVGKEMAQRLHASIGDRLVLNFSKPVDPLLPRFQHLDGQVNVSAGGIGPIPTYLEPVPWSHPFAVAPGSVRLSVVVAWTPSAQGQDLDIDLESPTGRTYANHNGTVDHADIPAVVNLTASLAHPLESGSWTLHVHAKAAAQTVFNATILTVDPVYDLAAFQRRVQDLRAQFPDFDPSTLAKAAPPESHAVRVAWIADAGKGPHFKLPHAFNLFARLDSVQSWLDRPGEINLAKVSNLGGVESGADESPHILPLLRQAVNRTKAAEPGHPAIQALKATDDKAFWLEQAKHVGELFQAFLTFIASFSVLAGLLLIINIFTMLAEERKTELGISRAVGLRRGHLARMFTIEGALYAVPAAALGTAAGLGLAALLIAGFNAFGDPEVFPPIPFRVEPHSLWLAFGIGLVLTLATIWVAAWRAGRLNIVRAIRNIEEPERLRGRVSLAFGLLLGVGGLAYSIAALVAPTFPAIVLGPSLLAVGVAQGLRRRFSRKAVYPTTALALFAYHATTLFLYKENSTQDANIYGPVRAILMALCLVILLVYTERTARWVGRLARSLRPLRAIALPAISYPLHRKFRTGMTLAMFGVILLVVMLFTIFAALFEPNPDKESGGYDVQATTTVPIDRLEGHGTDATLLSRVDHYDILPHVQTFGGRLIRVSNQTTGQFGPPRDTVYGIGAAFADHNRFSLVRRDPAYASDRDAYRAVAAHDDVVIVAYSYSTDEQGNDDVHHVGETLQVEARGGVKTFRIIGVQEQYHFKAIWVSRTALAGMFADPDTAVLIDLKPGQDAGAAAQAFEADYRDVGMDAASIRSEVLKESEQFRQIFTLIRLFLSLGLVVGILSLGIVTARSVIERRQEIGMMRALGFRRRDVRRAFTLEMLTMVTLGLLVGTLVAIVVSLGLWVTELRDLRVPYVIPWTEVLEIALVAYVATTLATLAPIRRAAKIPPAEALRYIE